MGIDYEAKIIFGIQIPDPDEAMIERIMKYDTKFNPDYEKAKEKDLSGTSAFAFLVEEWLSLTHSNLIIDNDLPYYDCSDRDKTYYLTYETCCSFETLTPEHFKTILEKSDPETFSKVAKLLIGEDKEFKATIFAIPFIW